MASLAGMVRSTPSSGRPFRVRGLRSALFLSALSVLSVTGLYPASSVAGAVQATNPTDPSGWTVYHRDPAGSGVAPTVTSIDTASPAWTSHALDGQLYGEPLVEGHRVFVATENDTVYALSSSGGAVLWSTHVGTPVPSSSLPCGDITPTVGITGTPVVDPSRGELFVVADEFVDGRPSHRLVGLDTTSGAIVSSQDVDPAGSTPEALLQRTGLALSAGRVIFGFGGNDGDCSTYRGWVVAVGEQGGDPIDFAVDSGPGQTQGAVWMGGAAPVVDAGGNVWVSAGNGSVTTADKPYDDSDSVLELSPTLSLLQYFAPTSWATDNLEDRDFSMAPVLLPDGQVLIAGKSRIAYLLDGSRLGGIGGQLAQLPAICTKDVDGGAATVGDTVFLPCLGGIIAIRATPSPAGLDLVWSSGTGGGPPIVAAGLVWTIGQDGTLSGLDPTDGSVRQQTHLGVPANHFPTPSVGDGLLLAPVADSVVAFTAGQTGSVSATGTTSTTVSGATTTSRPPGHPHPPAPGGTPAGLIVGVVLAALVVGGGSVWLIRRRRAGSGPNPPD